MTEDAQNLARRVQDQTVDTAREFFGASLGWLKHRLRDDRSQLEYLAQQLRQEEARARIQGFIESYSAIEESIEEAARDLGLEDTMDEAAPQDAGEQVAVGQAAQDTVAGAANKVAGQIGQVAENLPGAQLLGRTTDESGRTVQRLVDESGDIIETTLDESGELLDETLVGNLADLPVEEESINEEGHTLRIVRDESGTLIKLQLGPEGSVLDLQIPDNA